MSPTNTIVMPHKDKTVTLVGLADGAVEERFQVELAKVIDNIKDPNTEAEKARRITVTFVFSPDKERRHCGLAIDIAAKLVGPDGLYTDVWVGRHEGLPAVIEGPQQEKLFDTPEQTKPIVLDGGKH